MSYRFWGAMDGWVSTSKMTYAKDKMKQICIQDVQANFEQVLDDVLGSGEPVKILKDPGNSILVFKEISRGMTETLSLVSIPDMRESIRSGMPEHIADTTTDLEW